MRGKLVIQAVVILLMDSTLIANIAEGLICYRCDSVNQGESCENRPASRHIRNYGEEEPCLAFEDVNNQYLALQQDVDSDWYFSVFNGDHGIPFDMLKKASFVSPDMDADERRIEMNISTTVQVGSFSSLMHSRDRDFACLFIRSFFYDDAEPKKDHKSGTVLWFRKCVHLPALDAYPVCSEGNIYRGHIEICVCRVDKCNLDRIINARNTLITGHHIMESSSPSSYYPYPRCFLQIFLGISLKLLQFYF